jgi:hypothetical protein
VLKKIDEWELTADVAAETMPWMMRLLTGNPLLLPRLCSQIPSQSTLQLAKALIMCVRTRRLSHKRLAQKNHVLGRP